MHFAFTEEQEELREAARAFLTDHSGPDRVREVMESDSGWDDEAWKRIGSELGWPCVIVPEAYGGIGLSSVELVALLEVVGEALLCAPFFSSVCLAGQALIEFGSEAQKQEYLPELAEGRLTASLAFCEADGGWDPSALTTTATRDGDAYVLRGTKRYVLDGHGAALFVVAARAEGSEGDAGVSAFVVPADADGLSRRALPTLDQTRRQAEVSFDGVRVPASACMGDEGEAAAPLRRAIDRAAIALAAEQVGGAQRCLDMTVAYAKEREQFGRPIGSFQAIKHKCADMMVLVESARSAAYYAGCVAAEEDGDIAIAASLAKSYCSDAYFRCAGESIQVHGGVGFTWEYDPHLHFKRAQWGRGFLGDPDWHRDRVADRLEL
jgi:alkylation response protein AidB-like acyl-CoA dehydrogenase